MYDIVFVMRIEAVIIYAEFWRNYSTVTIKISEQMLFSLNVQ